MPAALLFLLFLITVLAPIAFWLWFFIWKDRAEPEPKKLLIKVFFLGIAVTFLASIAEELISRLVLADAKGDITSVFEETYEITYGILAILFIAGIVEEYFKYAALRFYIYRKTDFNQIADGVFYAVTLALGFSFLENIFYFFELLKTPAEFFIIIAFMRGISTTLLHITAAGLVGYALGKMKFSLGHKRIIIIQYLFMAMLIHSFYNILLLVPYYGIVLSFSLTLITFAYLMRLLKKPETKLIWRLVAPQKNPQAGSIEQRL